MGLKTFLKTLIVAEVALGVLFLLIPEPGTQTRMQAWEPPFTLLLIIAGLVSRIGLFVFWRPARMIFLLTIIAELVATPFSIPETHTGICAMLNEATIYIAGVILALVYFSPLRDLYPKPKASS